LRGRCTLVEQAAIQNFPERQPKVGELVQVRSRRWLVDEVIEPKRSGQTHVVRLSCADDDAVFITSANLTEAALDRNIELGILIRDRAVALTIGCYFSGLIDRGLLKPLPLA
jgi:phosphatidylserine/phosphatidylglycerophosphate/cardiolipin synthase-like enzyme